MTRGLRLQILLVGSLHLFALSQVLAEDQYNFDIREQHLSSALLEFARVAGVSVGFEASVTHDKTSVALHGSYPVEDALRSLLATSGLSFTRFPGGVFRVHAPLSGGKADETTENPAATSVTVLPRKVAEKLPSQRAIDEITTIGSRIRNSGFRELLPVMVIENEFIGTSAVFSTGDLFGFVPSAGINSFNGIDNYFYGVNDARGDVSTANLRGIGSGNSLLLLNGRRVVNHPGTQAENQVLATTSNFNALPLFAIERLEILLDGASSVYGSDAVAGVINAVVANDGDRTRLGLQHGIAESTSMEQTVANFQLSRALSDRGNVSLFAEFSRETGLPAIDRPFSASSDLRDRYSNTPFAGDRDLDNRSASGAWGQFKLPEAVMSNGQLLTSSIGTFHIQPTSAEGCLANLAPDLCVDDGVIDDELWFDNNHYRFLLPSIDRVNLFSLASFAVSDRVELYGEAGWYEAKSRHKREPSNPLSSHPITIPRDNYWNPFGPVNFDDGRLNPNRLANIDAPAEGMPILINTRGLGGFYRVVDAGPRIIEVENFSDRLLIGVRSWFGGWALDGAFLYSSARTEDVTSNRISSTLFQEALARDTPNAYNPFNGGDPDNPAIGDATPNDAAIIEPFLVDIWRRNNASLKLADFYMTNSEVFWMNALPVGMSFGAEWREEAFSERRDPRLNGEIGYTDIVTGETYASDVMQSSITPDSRGSRRVASYFGELAVSLADPSQNLPLIRSVDMNVAVRFEDYSDIGREMRPRIGLAWWLTGNWGFQASWSEGLRAPNLPQINASPVPRIQVVRDWYRCQALLNKGLIESLGACEIEAVRAVEVTTSGSASLIAETNDSKTFGLRYRSTSGRLRASLDYWQIDQSDVVGLFGEQNHVALDYLLRLDGSDNPTVSRAAPGPEDILLFENSGLEPVGLLQKIDDRYLNLDSRLTRGIDVALTAEAADSLLGAVVFDFRASRLLTSRQSVPSLGQQIVDANEPAIPFAGAGDLLEGSGQPRWRAAFRLAFERGNSHYGLFGRYVASVRDTSTIQDESDEFLSVDDWITVSAFAGLQIPFGSDADATLRLTINNLFDQSPPQADEPLGYFVGLHDAIGRSYNVSLVTEIR